MSASPAPPSPPSPLDVHDESVRIAVSALGDMSMRARSSSRPFSPDAPSPPPDPPPPDFVSRVSCLPLVGSALRAYEHGKASSRVVKYGAEMMESSVKNISRPVIHRLPVDQLDEFACRQLDRFERYRGRSSTVDDKMQVDQPLDSRGPIVTSKQPCDGDDDRGTSLAHLTSVVAHAHLASPAPPPDTESRTPTPQSQDSNRQVVPRSRWQTVLLEAGGIGAAVSEESMRRLRYCLQWLQYAAAHIDSQILILRDFIDSLQSYVIDPSESDAYISPTHMRTLHDVRRDVVNTIRQVVDVVSKYAGGTLPEPARARVRGFILHLPQRWASAANAGVTHGIPEGSPGASSVAGAAAGGTVGNNRRASTRYRKERNAGGPDRSLSATPASSRASSPLASSRLSMAGMVRPTASAATRAAQHILTLAMESLDMMRGVTGVVKESLDRADAWVERLRVIGLQRQHSASDEPPLDHPLPPSLSYMSASMSSSSSESAPSQPSMPGLTSTPSTPAQADTPLSTPSTTPASYPSPDGLRMGIRLSEVSARTWLSELRLDEDANGYETPKRERELRSMQEGGGGWEKQREPLGMDERERGDMIVDD